MIGAIETSYRGYRFRSRLEARWAVFFDALDIAWKYETEGYEVDGHRYLPDFHLPDLSLWCEVKPHLMFSLFAIPVVKDLESNPSSKGWSNQAEPLPTPGNWPEIRAAYTAARGARFEHGERGRLA